MQIIITQSKIIEHVQLVQLLQYVEPPQLVQSFEFEYSDVEPYIEPTKQPSEQPTDDSEEELC